METKKKLNRAVHGNGQKVNPNMHRVVVYLYNPIRKGSPTGKGSNDFKTTHTFKDVNTIDHAISIINEFAENHSDGGIKYSVIKKAYYNGRLLINDRIVVGKELIF